jgi:hypothetical protein
MPDGAVGDPASAYHLSEPRNVPGKLTSRGAGLGNAFLIRNWTRTDLSNTNYSFDAGVQLDYLLNHAPRTRDGAISVSESSSLNVTIISLFAAATRGPG